MSFDEFQNAMNALYQNDWFKFLALPTVQKGRKQVQRVVVDAPLGDMAILKISLADVLPIGGW